MKKRLQIGQGEAIQRLWLLDMKIKRRIASVTEKEEYQLILDALNETKIDLGFDCDGNGVPDSIEIFAATAKTSCCRLDMQSLSIPKVKKRKTRSR